MNFSNLLYVGIGGMIGSIFRYLAGLMIRSERFPAATLSVNIIGSFIIGLMFGMASRHDGLSGSKWWLLAVTGICGGFTTFSAFSLESFQLIQQNRLMIFAVYVGTSILSGLAATYAGYLLSK